MNAAIEAGKAIEKVKKMRAKTVEAIERSRQSHTDKYTQGVAELEAALSAEARSIYDSHKGT